MRGHFINLYNIINVFLLIFAYIYRYAKIKLTAAGDDHYYSVIGESNTYTEAENENVRCETPQYLPPVSSPSSPHSVVSNK